MRSSFFGWYFRCQSDHQTVAVIPAVHKEHNRGSCSIQLITDSGSWSVPFPYDAYRKSSAHIEIGDNRFSRQGIRLNIASPTLTASGELSFGAFTPLKYDIMGPFCRVPFMECRHSVLSMRHTVTGQLTINGVSYVFHDGTGYLEGDRGRSFPKEYAWTQCSYPNGSLMLSVADIPLGVLRFTGVIGAILWKGKEYRLATYLGAKAVRIRDGEIIIRQGSKTLIVRQLERSAQPLRAPAGGAMTRTIHEHATCKAFYCFQEKGRTIFSFEAPNAAFEYEYPR